MPCSGVICSIWFWELPLLLGLVPALANTEMTITAPFSLFSSAAPHYSWDTAVCGKPQDTLRAVESEIRGGSRSLSFRGLQASLLPWMIPEILREIYHSVFPNEFGTEVTYARPVDWCSQYTGFDPHTFSFTILKLVAKYKNPGISH